MRLFIAFSACWADWILKEGVDTMRIKFWGVRGSIPTPEHRNSRYGGNTTCVEVRLNDGTLIILDCGSGLRGLGNSLLREFGQEPVTGYIFLTHFHWDHIQGIPFFAPLYKSGSEFHFHAVRRKEQELAEVIQGQIANPYFPVDMRVLSSTRRICDLDYGPRNIKGAIVSSAPLNHPQGCVAYRVEADGCKFVLATDTEPGSALHDRSLRELARGADVLVYDSQYTPEQLQGAKKGWGHSSWLAGNFLRSSERRKVWNLSSPRRKWFTPTNHPLRDRSVALCLKSLST